MQVLFLISLFYYLSMDLNTFLAVSDWYDIKVLNLLYCRVIRTLVQCIISIVYMHYFDYSLKLSLRSS